MRALVIGNGSIGARHQAVLTGLGCEVHVVSRRAGRDADGAYRTISAACRAHTHDFAIIANETASHLRSLGELNENGFRGRVLVEKPVLPELGDVPDYGFAGIWVGYNLRFHPVLRRLRALLADRPVISVSVYVGQYLPEWRPQVDYSESYSARRSFGGGVLRDLSHEIDYVRWLVGPWQRVTALGGHFSSLRIDSDDAFALLGSTTRSPIVTVNMNYLDRRGRREVVVNTDARTFRADLVASTLEVDHELTRFDVTRDTTYQAELRALLDGDTADCCTLEEGLDAVRVVEAAEQAAAELVWVSL